MSDIESLLIDIIQHYLFLFDKGSKDFKDANKKGLAWQNIAAALSCTVEEAQRVWKLLRERYSKERRVIQCVPSGSEAGPDGIWPLFYQMGFMEKHIATRKRTSNVSRPSSTSSVFTPLTSPIEDTPNVWASCEMIVTGSEETGSQKEDGVPEEESNNDSAPPKKKLHLQSTPTTSVDRATPRKSANSATAAAPTSGRAPQSANTEIVQETLGTINKYLQNVNPDKNCAFEQYVGLTLSEMPTKEQNYKKLKIVEILNKPFDE